MKRRRRKARAGQWIIESKFNMKKFIDVLIQIYLQNILWENEIFLFASPHAHGRHGRRSGCFCVLLFLSSHCLITIIIRRISSSIFVISTMRSATNGMARAPSISMVVSSTLVYAIRLLLALSRADRSLGISRRYSTANANTEPVGSCLAHKCRQYPVLSIFTLISSTASANSARYSFSRRALDITLDSLTCIRDIGSFAIPISLLFSGATFTVGAIDGSIHNVMDEKINCFWFFGSELRMFAEAVKKNN